MRTLNTDIIEGILRLNDKIIKYAEMQIFQKSGITITQFNILGEIIVNKYTTINQLKNNLIISSPALSQMLGRMEKNELIEREVNKLNKREMNILVTLKGKKLYNEINVKYISLVDEKLKGIRDEDKAITLQVLDGISDIVK